MPEMTSYPAGTPSWVDLSSPDIDGSVGFYTELFGWEPAPIPDPQAGGYTMFRLRGKNVAAVGPILDEGQPPVWSMYITTDDAAATAAKIAEAGGTVLAEPFDVMGAGTMAAAQDPTGAFFNLWQPATHIGAEIVNEPGSLTWNELVTTDPAQAEAFYGAVFGWTSDPMEMADGAPYFVQMLGERPAGGIMRIPERWGAVPPHWVPYFAVAGTDEVAARSRELGGRVSAEPFDTPVGRVAFAHDPHGAGFAVITATAQPQ